MKRIYITCCIIAISIVTNAQQTPLFSWNLGIGSNSGDKVADMVVDNADNIISVGSFSNTVNFDPSGANFQTSQGSGDIYVAKYKPNGSCSWVKALGGSSQDAAKALVTDASNNVYVLGDFTAGIDYNPGAAGVHTFTGQTGLTDMILLKYDSAGTFIWAKQIGGTSIDYSYDLGIDANNNLYACGYFYQTSDFNPDTAVANNLTSLGQGDAFIAKYDNNGNFVWVKQIGAAGMQNIENLTVDNGNIVISGAFTDSPDFDPSAAVDSIANQSQYGRVIFFAKYDLNGNYIWAKGIQSNSFATAGEHTVDNNGNIYITGCYSDTTDFDPSNGSFTYYSDPGRRSIYFAKYDSNGNLMWAKEMNHPTNTGQDYGYAIAVDGQNNVFVSGQFYGQGCDFNPSPTATAILGSNSSNNWDIFIGKYTSNGDYIWAYNIGDSGTDEGVKVVFDSYNSLIFATNIGTSSFGGAALPSDYDFTTGVSEYASVGGNDFTITKYTQCFINPATSLIGNTITSFANNVSYQWLNCEVGFAPIANATLQSFTPTNTGSYACMITSGGCVDTTICISVDLCAGITNTVTINAQTLTLTCSVIGATYQWIRADVGNLPIAGATSQTYTPTANGSYACKITKNGCISTSAPVTVDKVGITEFADENNISLYPNPAKDFVVIKLNNAKNITLSMFDARGTELLSNNKSNNNQFDVNTQQLAQGLYFIKLTDSITGNSVTKRFIKQ